MQSENVATLTDALAKAQSEFTVVPKNKTGQEGNRKFKYADLADVMNMALPKLNKYGIFLSQPLVKDGDGANLRQTTRVQLGEQYIQTDGIKLSDDVPGKNLGISVTYARRIDLNGLLGIAPDEDMDAPDLKADKLVPTASQGYQQYSKITPAFPNLPISVTSITGFPYGANEQTNQANPTITDDDLPNFDGPTSQTEPLAPDAQAVADHLATFVPLTEKRNTEIQNRLKDLVANKTVGRRDLSLFLEDQHDGKKQFDVDAKQWEATIAKIEAAVTDGSIKTLLKSKKGQ